MDSIMKQGARVLMPSQWEALRKAMVSEEDQKRAETLRAKGDPESVRKAEHICRYQIIGDALLLTGMRPIEFSRMQRSWYRGPRRCIVLPKGACKKEKCEYTERTVLLSLPGCDAVERYFNSGIKMPTKVSMRDALRRYAVKAGIGEEGITPKMWRKSCVSWLVACFEEKHLTIASSMGHDVETIRKNYLGLGFPASEIELMKNKYFIEWGKSV